MGRGRRWTLTSRATQAGKPPSCVLCTRRPVLARIAKQKHSCGTAMLTESLHTPCCAREFAEETLGLFGDCSVTAAGVQLAANLIARQLRAKAFTLHVKHQLKSGVYHMFVALLPHVEPLMFHLATQQNLQTGAVEGAEKTAFAWCAPCKPYSCRPAAVSSCSPGICSRQCECAGPGCRCRGCWLLRGHAPAATSSRVPPRLAGGAGGI